MKNRLFILLICCCSIIKSCQIENEKLCSGLTQPRKLLKRVQYKIRKADANDNPFEKQISLARAYIYKMRILGFSNEAAFLIDRLLHEALVLCESEDNIQNKQKKFDKYLEIKDSYDHEVRRFIRLAKGSI